MDLTFLYLLPLIVAIILIFAAVRAHERYWTLGFLGWRKVYAGLGCYLVAGLLYAVEFWVLKSTASTGVLRGLEAGVVVFGIMGLILVLAGSIERLRELSAERMRLEDVRAGFDLFDSLREIVAQPYAFLEVLDYALKEMVRAAGVDSGGLWLYNPKKSDWVLTGWANLPEKLRQQTESVTGSGTGFDRLAAAHKARLFATPERIRLFFPEWEAEGYQSILGLPLTSGAVGSAGRQILGAIVLADRSTQRFDDDRARRLYAASDYVAAVIAEARITRQLDAVRQQLEETVKELEREREEARRQKAEAADHLERMQQSWQEEQKSLETAHASKVSELRASFEEKGRELRSQAEERLSELKARSMKELHSVQTELEKRLAAESERAEQMHARWLELGKTAEQLEKRLESERANWEARLDELHRGRKADVDQARQREEELKTQHRTYIADTEERFTSLEQQLETQNRLASEQAASLQAAEAALKEREAAITSERKAREEASANHRAAVSALETRLATLDSQLESERQNAATLGDETRAARDRVQELESAIDAERGRHATQIEDLSAQLDSLRQTAEADRRRHAEEVERLSGELETALVAAESERNQHAQTNQRLTAQLEKLWESAEAESRKNAEMVARLEAELEAERGQREATGHEIETLRTEWSEFETSREREVVEERLKHQRALHKLRARADEIVRHARELAEVRDGSERLNANLRLVRNHLPPGTQLYLWQREPGGGMRMISWVDSDANILDGLSLTAWPFETQTIPAEGITRLTSPGHWESVRHQQPYSFLAEWAQHWGEQRTPRWAVCWPWGASAEEMNGWVTAFGFGEVLITDRQIENVETWVGFLASSISELSESAVSHTETDTVGTAPAGMLPDEAEPPSDQPLPSQELHHTIIQWAADQTEDVFNLDLAAPPGVPVDRSWLRRALDRGRASCRLAGQPRAEFSVSTTNKNGSTVLRFVRTPETEAPANADLTAVEDNDLSVTLDTGADAPASPITGRWLIQEGNTIGMELRFVSKPQAPRGGEEHAMKEHEHIRLSALVVNESEPMRELLVGMIEALDGTASSAADFQEAEERIAANGVNVAIVDTTMTGDVGWDIARRLVTSHPQVPVLLIIGADTTTIPDDAAGHWLLRMPFQIEELRECLEGMRIVRPQNEAVSRSE